MGDYLKALEAEWVQILLLNAELPLSLNLLAYEIERCKKLSIKMKALEAEWVQILLLNAELPLSLNLLADEIERCKKLISSPAAQSEPILADHSGDGEVIKLKALEAEWIQILLLNAEIPLSLNLLAYEIERCKKLSSQAPALQSKPIVASCSDNSDNGASVPKEDDSEKAHRILSPELLSRFLQCVDQLGGPQAAEPKRILELMNVDGLTSDEVSCLLREHFDEMPPRIS